MSDKYIIKITRKRPTQWEDGGKEEIHYYHKRWKKDLSGKITTYEICYNSDRAYVFTKQECRKVIEEIKPVYEKPQRINGKLVKIEILDAETKKVVSMYESGCSAEPEVIITRFELIDL